MMSLPPWNSCSVKMPRSSAGKPSASMAAFSLNHAGPTPTTASDNAIRHRSCQVFRPIPSKSNWDPRSFSISLLHYFLFVPSSLPRTLRPSHRRLPVPVFLQIPVQTGPVDSQHLRRPQPVPLAHSQHPLNMLLSYLVQ